MGRNNSDVTDLIVLFLVLVVFVLATRDLILMYRDSNDSAATFKADVEAPFRAHGVQLP